MEAQEKRSPLKSAIEKHKEFWDVSEQDYDHWLGPAPKREFNSNCWHSSWRWFYDYAGGMICDVCCFKAFVIFVKAYFTSALRLNPS